MSSTTKHPEHPESHRENLPKYRFRTAQEKLVYAGCLVGLAIVNFILVETGWSWTTTTVLLATTGLIVILAWIAYLRWRQQRPPLSAQVVGQSKARTEDLPPKRIWFTRAELVFWAYTGPTYGLMIAFVWLDWSRSATLAAWWVIIGIHALVTWIIWMVRRSRTLKTAAKNHG